VGFISLTFGVISLITLGLALLASLEPLIWAVAVPALVGLLLGLSAAQKRNNVIAAWAGIICSGLALIAASITFGIGRAL